MSRQLPPDEGHGVEQPPRPPQPYVLPPQVGPYAPPPAGGPYAQPLPGGPYAGPPPGGPYAQPPHGGPYVPSPPGEPYTPPGRPPFAPAGPGQPAVAGGPMPPGPPGSSAPLGAFEEPATEMAPPRRTLSPRARRTSEIIALVVLLPLLLGLHWYDDRTMVRTVIERPEAVTVVARGTTATLNRVQWTMLGRDTRAGSQATGPTPGTARLKLQLAARPLDAKAADDLRRARFGYRIRDREGHVWTATAVAPDTIAAGAVITIPVTSVVPPDRLTSVVLEIVQPKPSAPKGPLDVLRFAH